MIVVACLGVEPWIEEYVSKRLHCLESWALISDSIDIANLDGDLLQYFLFRGLWW